jgi:hypothetical protein
MHTVADALSTRAHAIKSLFDPLFCQHSQIKHEPSRAEGGIFIMGCSYWQELPLTGKQLQGRSLLEYKQFAEILRVLLKGQPKNLIEQFNESTRIILEAIEQNGMPRGHTSQDVYAEAVGLLDAQTQLVRDLYPATDQSPVYVPDTNALLWNPDLEDWRFADVPRFTLALVPTVLSELDLLKVNSRNELLQKKAEGLISRIKEYRRRGTLAEGVTIRNNVSNLVSFTVEPDFGNTLNWLAPDNKDDRLLASSIEVMRQFLHKPVILVTRDINLQNKAEFAGFPFAEPPDPSPPLVVKKRATSRKGKEEP